MANRKVKATDKKNFTLTPQFPKFAGYADYFLSTPVSVQIQNDSAEAAILRVFIESDSGLIVPFETQAEVPFESAVALSAEGIFSPLFLAENDALKACAVTVRAELDGKEVCRESVEITALPFDWWEGLEGNAERLAAFVRPRLADCAAVLADAGKRLKRWKANAEFYGYAGADKNDIRQIAAAIYAAVKSFSVEKAGECDLSAPLPAARAGSILKEHAASELELAVFAAACMEAAHLNPVLAVGRGHVGVGVWLYESCFLDSVTDDGEIVGKYISEGINNLSFFDADDLFSASNAAFTPSEGHFRQKLRAGLYEVFVDVRRCRMGGVRACPLRGKGLKGYELLKEEEMTDEAAPAPIPVFRKLKLEGKQPKNKQWERRLLDLTPKNTLLNFTGKNALHLNETSPDELYRLMTEVYSWDAVAADDYFIDYQNMYTHLGVISIRNLFTTCADAFHRAGEDDRALEMLDRCEEIMKNYPLEAVPLGFSGNDVMVVDMVGLYYELGAADKALALASEMGAELLESLRFYARFYDWAPDEVDIIGSLVYLLADEMTKGGDAEQAKQLTDGLLEILDATV